MQNKYYSKSLTINVLEKPYSNSNISSQIIYGESFKILSKHKNFYKVKSFPSFASLKESGKTTGDSEPIKEQAWGSEQRK